MENQAFIVIANKSLLARALNDFFLYFLSKDLELFISVSGSLCVSIRLRV